MMSLLTALCAVIFFAGFFLLVAVMIGLLWLVDRFLIGPPQNAAADGDALSRRAELPDLVWDAAIWL
jgi:hypothetical protein